MSQINNSYIHHHFIIFHQLWLFIFQLDIHSLLSPTTLSHPPVCMYMCVCVRSYVRLCAEARVQVRRGFRRWAWRVHCRMPTSWRWMLSSSWTTPSWAGTAARWASDLQAALCLQHLRLPLARTCREHLEPKWTESNQMIQLNTIWCRPVWFKSIMYLGASEQGTLCCSELESLTSLWFHRHPLKVLK